MSSWQKTHNHRNAAPSAKQENKLHFCSKCILNTFASILVPRFLDKLEDIQSKLKILRSPTNICTQSKSLKYHFQEKPHQCFVMWFLPSARLTTSSQEGSSKNIDFPISWPTIFSIIFNLHFEDNFQVFLFCNSCMFHIQNWNDILQIFWHVLKFRLHALPPQLLT